MKKILILSVSLFLSIAIFAQNIELSNKIIKQYKQAQYKAMQPEATTHDHLWLTPLLNKAIVNWDELTPEAKLLFAKYKGTKEGRPVLEGTEEVADGDFFRFHYTTDAGADESVDPTDENGNEIPDYIEMIYDKFEYVTELYHTETGLAIPPGDGTNGGDDKYDIYISGDAAGEGTYGYVAAEENIGDNPNTDATETDAYNSYMVLRNNYDGFEGDTDKSLSVTVAHEYMHAVQNGYSAEMETWLMEIFATWSEEFAYPGYDDNFQYIMSLYGMPDVALNLLDDEAESQEQKGHWYGSCFFGKYLTEQTNNEIVKKLYERCVDDYAITAIDEELKANWNSDLETMFIQFAIANVLMTNDAGFKPYVYERANDYRVRVEQEGGFAYENSDNPINFAGNSITWDSKTDGNDVLMRMSADYFQLTSNTNFKISLSSSNDQVGLVLLKTNSTSVGFDFCNAGESISVDNYANWTSFIPIIIRFDPTVEDVSPADYSFTIENATTSVSNLKKNVSVYPNPATNAINIASEGYEMISFKISDITGKTVISNRLSNSSIDINNLDSGLYFIKLFDKNGLVKTNNIVIKK